MKKLDDKYNSENKEYWIKKMSGDPNEPVIEFPKNKTIIDLFHKQVEKTPNEIAVVFKENILTYKELDILSDQLAHYLINEQNVTLGDYVAIIQRRTEMLIVSILGILKSGAAYVPIDPDYPQQRIDFLQNDSNCKFTLNHDAIDNFLSSKEKHPVDHPPAIIVKPNDLAYIIYTSGSTGNPKGVMIEHRNLIHYLLNIGDYIDPYSSNSGCFAHLSHSFDASIQDIFLPLIFGKKLILISGTGLEIFDDKNLLQYAPYDFINITPSHISILISILNKESQPKLTDKYVIGGEPLYNYHINQFKFAGIDATIVNDYGPTEATVACVSYEFNTFDTISTESIPIGKPISNTEIYVLDENRQLILEGEIGEIYIAGNGVARGYLNREDLTSEKFVPNPFDIGTKMYRTGDLAQWLPDGNLLYCGRIDEQVKVNGHRIELGEIEAALIALPQVKKACAIISFPPESEPRLVAYIQATKNDDKHFNVREELSKTVPSFMIPSIFMWVDDFPLTTNGKIDKKSLPAPEYQRPAHAPIFKKPITNLEKEIAKIWSEQLQIPLIGIDDNFFEMGGHSIMAVNIMIKIEAKTGKRIPLSALFAHPTVEKFAKLVSNSEEIDSGCIVPLKPNGSKVPFFMIHGGGLNVLNYINMSKHFDEDQPFYAIQGVGDNGFDNWYKSIDEMAAHYVEEIVKINPTGPYAIGGFCVGGFVAFEVVRQLKAQGKEVSLTALLDSYADSSYYCKTYNQKKRARKHQQTYKRLVFLKDMLTSWESFKKRFNSKKDYILKRHFEQNNTMSEQEILAQQRFAESVGKITSLLDRYHLTPQNIDVEIFRSKNCVDHQFAPPHLGWKKAALKGLNVYTIPSDNFDIRVAPNDKILARMFQDILDKKHLNIKS